MGEDVTAKGGQLRMALSKHRERRWHGWYPDELRRKAVAYGVERRAAGAFLRRLFHGARPSRRPCVTLFEGRCAHALTQRARAPRDRAQIAIPSRCTRRLGGLRHRHGRRSRARADGRSRCCSRRTRRCSAAASLSARREGREPRGRRAARARRARRVRLEARGLALEAAGGRVTDCLFPVREVVVGGWESSVREKDAAVRAPYPGGQRHGPAARSARSGTRFRS